MEFSRLNPNNRYSKVEGGGGCDSPTISKSALVDNPNHMCQSALEELEPVKNSGVKEIAICHTNVSMCV